MTNPDMAAVLRSLKIPDRMAYSKALRDFLLVNTSSGHTMPDSQEQLSRLIGLLILSHLEVVNALGSLEETASEETLKKFHEDIDKFREGEGDER